MSLTERKRLLGARIKVPSVLREEVVKGKTNVEPFSNPFERECPSSQVTESEPHRKGRTGHYESGGPFYTARRHVNQSNGSFRVHSHDNVSFSYSGPYSPGPLDLWYSDFVSRGFRSQDTSDLDPKGAEAIAQCSPVNPNDTLGQGILENYKDGLPHLPGIHSWEKRVGVIKSVGDEFLNVVFGWKPLVSEVQHFASTARNARDILKQYHRDAGSNIRRTFYFPATISEKTDTIAEGTFAHFANGFSGSGEGFETDTKSKVFRTEIVRREQWFSGAFTYAVPNKTPSWRRMLGYGSDADKLFGIALTPELLWNLAPWSWAVDWFSDSGDVITNISNFSGAGLIMRYGFMMERTSTILRYTMDRSSFFINGVEIPPPAIEGEISSSVRRQADPYGFGVHTSGLSPLQIAIAAAVGISLL